MPEVRLRLPGRGDVAARLALGRSPAITRMYGDPSPAPMTRHDAARWICGLRSHPHAWIIEADGALAGEVRLDALNPTDRRARLAIGLVADPLLGRGIGRQAIALVLEQAFGPLGLHRVDLRVLAFNTRAIRCYLACGFVHEGTERQSALIDGTWHDDWIMSILDHEFHARAARG